MDIRGNREALDPVGLCTNSSLACIIRLPPRPQDRLAMKIIGCRQFLAKAEGNYLGILEVPLSRRLNLVGVTFRLLFFFGSTWVFRWRKANCACIATKVGTTYFKRVAPLGIGAIVFVALIPFFCI
jgi:hypothetical protein